jgi:hypothetical protein
MIANERNISIKKPNNKDIKIGGIVRGVSRIKTHARAVLLPSAFCLLLSAFCLLPSIPVGT